jgi:hypothetical protein
VSSQLQLIHSKLRPNLLKPVVSFSYKALLVVSFLIDFLHTLCFFCDQFPVLESTGGGGKCLH